MARDTKVRPTLTIGDCLLVASCLKRDLENRINNGQVSNPIIIQLAKLKDYFLSFQSEEDRIEMAVQQRMAALGMSGAQIEQSIQTSQSMPTLPELSEEAILAIEANISPIDRKDLTEGQIFDLLNARNSKQRTEEENKWFLEKGIHIKLKRNGFKSQNVNEGDL